MTKQRWPGETQQIENKAWQVLQRFLEQFVVNGLTIPSIPPVPVQDIAQLLAGLAVVSVSNLQHKGQRLSGLLQPDIHLISCAAEDIPARQTFSIAHELGHFFLHYLALITYASQPTLFPLEDFPNKEHSEEQNYYRCSGHDISMAPHKNSFGSNEQADLLRSIRAEQLRTKREREANQFASALLMPIPYVERLIQEGIRSPRHLAEQLGVSPLAAEIRLVQLGYQNGLERDQHPADPIQGSFS